MNGERKGIVRTCCALFFAFMFLAYLFPYTGDDWAWGSSIGLGRLKSFFAGYNGRYVGNLIVLLLTRSKLLDAVVMAASFADAPPPASPLAPYVGALPREEGAPYFAHQAAHLRRRVMGLRAGGQEEQARELEAVAAALEEWV